MAEAEAAQVAEVVLAVVEATGAVDVTQAVRAEVVAADSSKKQAVR